MYNYNIITVLFIFQNDNYPHMTLEEAVDLCRMQCLSVAMRIILPLCQRAKLRRIKAKWNRDALLFLRMVRNDWSYLIVFVN